MQVYANALETSLKLNFEKIIAVLYSERARDGKEIDPRLNDFLRAAPKALVFLAEPWWGEMTKDREKLFFACANLHLYARILDDAVDEGGFDQRLNLLFSQPYYWRAVETLTSVKPALADKAFNLINETVQAAACERPDPKIWARKNHHLLLTPLFLADNLTFFENHKPSLSLCVGLLQAEDEVKQNKCGAIPALCAFVEKAANATPVLAKAGWKTFVQRVIAGCDGILTMVRKNATLMF